MEDQRHYSWWFGDNSIIVEARRRCEQIPMLSLVLQQLMQFDGNARMQYKVKNRCYRRYDDVGIASASYF